MPLKSSALYRLTVVCALIGLAVCGLVSSSVAAPLIRTCDELFQGKIVLSDADVPESFVGEVIKVIRNVQAVLPPEVRLPKNLTIHVEYEKDAEDPIGFFPLQNRIELSYLNPATQRPLRHILPVVAHEYGHAIFRENISSHTQSWAKEIANSLAPGFKGMMPDQATREGHLWRITEPYDEYFADTIAVLAFRDGEAIHKYARELKDRRSSTLRNFTVEHPLEAVLGMKLPDSAHEILSPTRSFLWKKVLENPATLENPRALVPMQLRAIGSELDYYNQTGRAFEPVEANQRLIEAIKAEVAKTK